MVAAVDRLKTLLDLRNMAVLRLGVLISLGLIILAGFAALALVQGVERETNDVVHTYEVRNQARELTMALSEAESSQRGFVLTRDERHIEPYQRAAAAIGTRLETLLALTQDEAELGDRIRTIANAIKQVTAEGDEIFALVQQDRVPEATALLRARSDSQAMEAIRQSMEDFINGQNASLQERNASIQQWRRLLLVAIVVALIGAVLLAYVLFERTRAHVGELSRARAALFASNQELEARVQERTEALEEARAHADHERQRAEVLLHDASHRIGNSLATVSSLLSLQVLRSPSPEVRDALEAARARVHSIASAHRRLRLGHDLESASADEFLDAVLEDLAINLSSVDKISIVGQIEPILISSRDATTVGILLGELVTNATKHAFRKSDGGTVMVSLKRVGGVPTLSVGDNGSGIRTGQVAGEGGLGSVVIKQLANQFGGKPHYEQPPEGGLIVIIPLPGLDGKPS